MASKTTTRQQLHQYVDQLSSERLAVALDFVSYLLQRDADQAGEARTIHPEPAALSAVESQSKSNSPVDLAAVGIDKKTAETLRNSLITFSEEWDSPEMDIYDDYDAAKADLETR